MRLTLRKILPTTILVSALALSSRLVSGQQASAPQPSGLLPGCGTSMMVERSLAENPHLRANIAALEQQSADFMKKWQARHGAKSPLDTTIVIPVVVHIIHTNGSDNISKAQVDDAIRIINEDFNRTSADTGAVTANFKPIVGTTKMVFRLATKDPNGNCTQGVTRTYSLLTNSAGENVKQLIGWPTERYYNIWVVGRIASGAGGYAFYPGTAPRQSQEGVVVLNTQFGSIGLSSRNNFSSRTMTHETGHFFNLPHTWGSTNSPGLASNCNVDDGVADTPNTIGVSNQSCPLSMVSCGFLANVENYMDYSTCGRMFTEGQSIRMRASAASNLGLRSNLWQASNLIATGTADPYQPPLCPPIAIYIPRISQGCGGKNIAVFGYAYNAPDDTTLTWKWISPTATVDTLYGKAASFVYTTPGIKSVKLILYNAAGADTIMVANAYRIIDTNGGLASPFNEGFEADSFPSPSALPLTSRWYFDGGNRTWQRTKLASNRDTASLYIPLRQQPRNTTSQLFSPRISLAGMTRPVFLGFDHAFATAHDTANNRLIVSVSTDCGGLWQQIYIRTKSSSPKINTNVGGLVISNGLFVPRANEWRTNYVSLDRYLSAGNISIRFEVFNQEGNAIYLDNINVGSNLVTELDASTSQISNPTFRIMPNPSGASLPTAEISSTTDGVANLLVYSITGQLLSDTKHLVTVGSNALTFPNHLSGLQSGTYIAKILMPNGAIAQQKWVVIP